MKFLLTILVVVAFSVLAFGSVFLTNWVIHRRNLNKYDNYDRELSKQDMDYLSTAEAALETAAKLKTPKWYKIFLYTAFIPTMFLSWGVLAIVFGLAYLVLTILVPAKTSNELIYSLGSNGVGVLSCSVFAGLFLAGATLYALSLRKQALSNFIALNSDINGFDGEKVRQNILHKLEHNLRRRALFSTSKFPLDACLNEVNRSYRDGMLKGFYGCMIGAVVFGILDLRSQTLFFPDKIVSSGAYFSLGIKEDISYSDISHVELDCYRDDGQPNGSYTLLRGSEKIARIHMRDETLEPLDVINQKLRSEGSVQFEAREMKNGKRRLSSNCIQHLGEDLKQVDLVREILER